MYLYNYIIYICIHVCVCGCATHLIPDSTGLFGFFNFRFPSFRFNKSHIKPIWAD